MAGAGYKLFNTGDVLTAAQVNTYLNEQTVMVFASSAARTSALSGVLAEGMVSYLQDTNAVEVYNGSAWVGVGNVGDITEVQAGVGISVASGTGPIPVITNSSTDLITTAGDLLYGTAADTVARLGIGAAGRVLKVNSGATAPEWAVDPTTDVVTTAGDLIYGTGADAVTRLGIGTAGQVLKVNSGATAPEWGAASGAGSLVFINRTTFSNVASQAIDDVFSSTYQKYLVTLDNMSAATASDDAQLQFRYAGPTTQTTTYYSGVEQIGWIGANILNQVNNGSAINLSTNTGGSSNEQGSAYLFFSNVGVSTKPTVIINYVSAQLNVCNGFGGNDTARNYTGFLLKSASTNISGTVTVYGLANS